MRKSKRGLAPEVWDAVYSAAWIRMRLDGNTVDANATEDQQNRTLAKLAVSEANRAVSALDSYMHEEI